MAEEQSISNCCQPSVGANDSVLILGETPSALSTAWPHAEHQTPDSSLTLRYELAVLMDPQSLTTTETISQLVAVARDRWARQVLVLIPKQSNSHTTEREFFALGFKHRQLPDALKVDFAAYGFSITRYKATPDWLNSRYWANPERWNKN